MGKTDLSVVMFLLDNNSLHKPPRLLGGMKIERAFLKGEEGMADLVQFKKHKRSDISRLDKNYNDYFKSLFEQFPWFPRDFLIRDMRFPAADILEDKKRITVKAEIPGVNADDLDISLDGRRLTIKGEKKQERKKTEENLHSL